MQIAECNEPISRNIKRLIAEKGLKQKAVADRAGFSIQGFNSILKGRKLIKPCDVKIIANALNVSVNELYKEGE